MQDTGCSGLVHGDDPEGWDGEGGGRGVQDGEHMYIAEIQAQAASNIDTIHLLPLLLLSKYPSFS